MINRIIRIVSVVFLLFVICSLSVFFGTKIQRGEVSVAKSDQQTYYVAHTMFSPDPVLAAADYICDGVDDDVEIQQAVDALPATGGKIFIYAGDYHLSNAISRSIDNIWIEGAGKGTYLAYNASTPVINAGARNAWIISNLRTDVGGVYVSLATQCILQNVWIDTTLIAYRTQGYTISDSGDLTTKTYVDGKVPATMPSAFVASSGGAGDSGKGVLLNGSGKVDSSMISSTFSDNTTGVGATNYIVKWTGTSTQGSATNTDSQVSSAVSASHTQGADTALGSLSTKNSPVDADKTIYRNSESGDALVTSTWTQIKAFLKSYFDGIYGTGTDNTTGVGVNTYLVKWTSASTQSSATNTDAQVSAAVSASHTINTDTHLGIQDADLNMGTKNITNVGNVDGKDVSGLATAAEAVTAAKSDSDIADAINKKHAAGTDTALGSLSTKNPPIDADKVIYRNSETSDTLVTSTWTQVKSFLKTYFDGIYGVSSLYADNITVAIIGSPTYDNMQDFVNSMGSAGRKTGGSMTDAGSSRVAVTGGTGFIKATDDDNAQLLFFDFPAPANITIPADSVRYIGVEYNGGSPRVVSRTSWNWNLDSEFPLGRVINETLNGAETLHIINNPWWITDGMTNVIERFRSSGRVLRDNNVGGLIPSVTGTRSIAVTGGTLWSNLNEFEIIGIDTSVSGSFEYYWYKSGEGWQESDATQYSVTQWNDITKTSLQTIDNNKFCNIWIYAEADDKEFAILYPQAQYNTASEASIQPTPSAIPTHIANNGILIGKIVIKQGTNVPIAVLSSFTTTFGTAVATDHGNLVGLSDDDHTQYLLANGTRSMTGNLNMGATGNITLSAGMTVDGVDISTLGAGHTQNTDTHLGVQDANLNMGGENITNVGFVDGKDVSGLVTSAEAVTAAKSDSDIADAISKKHTTGTDTALGTLGTKNPPVDADKVVYRNSEASDVLVTSTWTQVKAFLKTYFDGVYRTAADNITGVGINTYLTKWSGSGIVTSATNTDSQVSSAVSASHTQGSDTALGTQSEDLNMGTFAITSVGNVDGKDVSGLATAAESVTAAKADGDISDAISKKHAQGTDTTLGTMTANINMGGDNITNVGFVDGVDISSISTHTQGTDTALGTVGTKNPPVDADKVVYRNSESSDVLVTATWTQVKAFLKAYFDGVYKTGTDNITGAGASGYMTKWSDEDTLVAGTNTDTDVADAVSKRHSSGSDTALGTQLEDLNMGTFAITSVGNVDGKDVSSLATAAEAVTAAKLDADISDAISKKHSAGSDTSLGTQVANLNMGGDNITNVGFVDGKDVSSLVTSADAVTAAKADGDISDAISKKHSAGSDTSLGTQIANLDMGTENITNVGYVDGVDVSTLTTSGIEFVIDGGGAAITTGEKGDIEIPFVCTITKVTMLADQSGSIAVDIWKDSYANYPPTDADSITASAVPTITTAVKSQDDTLTGWTKTVAAGSIIRYNVDSCDTITRVTISLTVTR